VTRIGGLPRHVVVRWCTSDRERGHVRRRGHGHQIRRAVVALVRLRIRGGGRPRLVGRWSVLLLPLGAVHTPPLLVVIVTSTDRHLRGEDVTGASLQFVVTAPLPRAVMTVGMRREDAIFLFHPSRPGVMLALARGRLGPRCLSAPTTVGPAVEAIKKKTWIHNVLLLIVVT